MLTTLDACPKKFFFEFILKLSPLAISPDLHAGGAFSHGCEVVRHCYYVEKMSVEDALVKGHRAMIEFWGDFEPPHYHVKTLENMLAALTYYFTEAFPLATDHLVPLELPTGNVATEFSFAIPMEVNHPDTNDPILFCGRSDLIAKYQNALLAIVDDKTTKALGDHWAKQWALRGQFIGYIHAARELGYHAEMAVIRGISILKKGFGSLEVIEQYPDWQIARWWEHANQKVRDAVDYFAKGNWQMSYGEACSAWGQCAYLPLDLAANPSELYGQYQERNWDPLRKNPTEPAEGLANIKYENVGNINDLEGEGA